MRRDREVQDLKFAPPNFLIRSVIRKIESLEACGAAALFASLGARRC